MKHSIGWIVTNSVHQNLKNIMELFEETLPYHVRLTNDDLYDIIGSETVDYDELSEVVEQMTRWCIDTITKGEWDSEYYDTEYSDQISDVFKFKYEKQRTMFLLKWSK